MVKDSRETFIKFINNVKSEERAVSCVTESRFKIFQWVESRVQNFHV